MVDRDLAPLAVGVARGVVALAAAAGLGLLVGTVSSVFVATPLLTYFQERYPMSRVKKEKVQRAPEDSGAVV